MLKDAEEEGEQGWRKMLKDTKEEGEQGSRAGGRC